MPDLGLTSNGDLNTIPETDREKIELTARGVRPPLHVKPLNLVKKLSETNSLGLTSQPSDRSRVGLLLSSTRSGLISENFTSGGQSSPTALSNRFRETLGSPLSIFRNPSPKMEMDEGGQTERDIRAIIDDEDEPKVVTRRRANSLIIIPEVVQFGNEEITEHPEVKEVSKLEISEIMTNPLNEGSAVQNCLICFDNAPDAVFMECGHGGKYLNNSLSKKYNRSLLRMFT